jgi:hypothetical protein
LDDDDGNDDGVELDNAGANLDNSAAAALWEAVCDENGDDDSVGDDSKPDTVVVVEVEDLKLSFSVSI